MYCSMCGKEIQDGLENCPYCGAVIVNRTQASAARQGAEHEKDWIVALLLCFFVGCFGIHRFYVRKNTSGLIMLILTITCVGVIISWPWAVWDFIMILLRKFKTADGQELV
ncbi:MAG: TM2 domain-containing protein [Succinivibrio sp.]|nr:TM2 domain-containing protein [Succinivibrio sp.]